MPGWRILLWIVLVIATISFLYLVRGILLPFILAAAISAILEPTIRRLRRRGWPRGLAIWTIVSLFLIVTGAFFVWLAPMVAQQVLGFRGRVDTLTAQLTTPDDSSNFFVRWDPVLQIQRPETRDPVDRILEQNKDLIGRLGLPTTKRALYAQYLEPQRPRLGAQIQNFLQGFLGIASGFVSSILMLMFVPLLVVMMLFNLEQFKRHSASWIPPAIRANTLAVIGDIGVVFASYLRGVAFAVFGYIVLMTLLMVVLGAPYAVLLGVLFGAFYLIPYLNGVFSGLLLLSMTGLSGKTGNFMFQTDSPWTFALILLGIFFVCHFVFDSFFYPRFVGKAVGLNPIVSMFVILSGGALFGLIGMIISFPLAGAVKVVLDRLIRITSTSNEGLTLPSIPLRHRASPNP